MSDLDITGPMPQETPSPARGGLFGRYVLLDRLGEGGAGQVYAGYDPELERKVAIKILGKAGDDAQAWSQTVREARVVARLAHPNVVVVHETGREDGVPFIVTELVDGKDLADWIAARPEVSTEDLLALFVAAGEGLAAAHAAGIVHGDFKPANVLVGRDGRPRVADFGVARLTATDHTTGESLEFPASGELADTKTEPLVGTPHYMAPEQFEGQPATTASDQYAFCQAFAEALAGVQLFRAKTIEALAVAKADAPQLDSPKRAVPRALWRVLERGLEVDPKNRHPSMAALLEAIGQVQSRRRTRRLGLGAAVLALGGAAAGYAALGEETGTTPCTGAERHLASVWTAQRATAIGSAMMKDHGALASEVWPRASAALDDYAKDWVAGHVDACTASAYREQSDATLEARMMCLGDRKDALEALVDALETASFDAVVNAIKATSSLPKIDTCADPDEIARVFAAVDPADAEAVAQLRKQVRRIEARRAVADFEGAQALVNEYLSQAETLGHKATEGQLRGQRARILYTQGKPDEAIDEAALAARLAVAGGDDNTAITALMMRVQFLADGNRAAEADDGIDWLEALIERSDDRRSTYAAFLAVKGWAKFAAGDHEAAETLLREAVQIRREEYGADDRRVAVVERNLGQLLRDTGQSKEAIEVLAHAKDVFAKELSPRHPEVAGCLNLMGTAQVDAGDMAGGKASIEEGLAISLEAFGPDHPGIALVKNNLASLAMMNGDVEEAQLLLDDVVRILTAVYGAEHPRVALVLGNVAAVALETGQPEKALESLERVEAIQTRGEIHAPDLLATLSNKTLALGHLERFEEAHAVALRGVEVAAEHLPPQHPDAAHAHQRIGWTHAHLGRTDEALAAYGRAIEAYGAEPPTHRFTQLLRDRADLFLETKRYPEAISDLSRADALLADQPPTVALVEVHFALAKALWGQAEDPAGAKALAKGAVAEANQVDAPDLAKRIEAWLEAV